MIHENAKRLSGDQIIPKHDDIITKADDMIPGAEENKQHQQKPKPLSFSISRILSDADDKQSHSDYSSRDRLENPRVPKLHVATVHHYAPASEAENYSHFESRVQPRACSTPEYEYPSPTPASAHAAYQQLPREFKSPNPSPYPYQRHFNHYHSHVLYSKSHDIHRSRDSLGGDDLSRNTSPEPELDTPSGTSAIHLSEQSSDKSLDSIGESYHQSPSPFKAKKKKTRTVFSRSQVYQLEAAFDMKRYLSSAERSGLATSLNLSETQIKIWFQNRRNKWKRQINGEMDEIPIPPAFASSYLPSSYSQPSINSYSHVMDARDELLRSSLTLPAYYSHPYAREKLHQPFLS